MRTLLIVSLLLAFVPVSSEVLARFDWRGVDLHAGQVIERNGQYLLKVENRNSKPMQATVLVIENPNVTASNYYLAGDAECVDVEGKGYLQMLSYYPNGGIVSSNSINNFSSPFALKGTMPPRQFILPTESGLRPSRLVLNVVLPGRGTVLLGPATLGQDDPKAQPPAPDPWWDDRTAGLLFGVLGSMIGLLGAVIGVLSSRGRARSFVFGAMYSLLAVGVAGLIAGNVALLMKQPYAVYYPLLLIGVLATVIPLGLLPRMKQHYAELELRKMQACDRLGA
ncbi:MAG: hypothetical protein ACYC6A_08390 [Armatimonadota bacterium]